MSLFYWHCQVPWATEEKCFRSSLWWHTGHFAWWRTNSCILSVHVVTHWSSFQVGRMSHGERFNFIKEKRLLTGSLLAGNATKIIPAFCTLPKGESVIHWDNRSELVVSQRLTAIVSSPSCLCSKQHDCDACFWGDRLNTEGQRLKMIEIVLKRISAPCTVPRDIINGLEVRQALLQAACPQTTTSVMIWLSRNHMRETLSEPSMVGKSTVLWSRNKTSPAQQSAPSRPKSDVLTGRSL